VDLASVKTASITPPNQGTAKVDLSGFDLVRTMAAREQALPITGSPLTSDPLLGPLKGNGGPTQTMAPAATSPVINAGSAFDHTTDQRGRSRPYGYAPIGGLGDGSDIGSFERQGPVFGKKTLVELALKTKRIPAAGPLPVVVSNKNVFRVLGSLSGKALAAKSFSIPAHGKATVKLDLPQKLQDKLKKDGKLELVLKAQVLDPARHRRTVTKTVTPKLKQ
jgi:hypothetical protein